MCSTILSLTPGIHIWNVYYKVLVCGYHEIYMHLCCYSAAKSCATLCDPVDCSTLSFPVLYHLPEFAQSHIHWSFPCSSDGKEFAWIAGDMGLILGLSQVGMSIESVGMSHHGYVHWVVCPWSQWVCPWSQWCHPTSLFSVIPFSSCLQYFPMSQLFASDG